SPDYYLLSDQVNGDHFILHDKTVVFKGKTIHFGSWNINKMTVLQPDIIVNPVLESDLAIYENTKVILTDKKYISKINAIKQLTYYPAYQMAYQEKW
ncbi:MAG: hypothetical protein CR996_00045, partial [Draconibacterium sp.]